MIALYQAGSFDLRSSCRLFGSMPGKKYRSIKNPKVYEALRRQGMSKQRAARISNAQSHKSAGTTAGSPLSGPGGLLGVPGTGSAKRRKWGNRTKNAACTCGVNVATKEQIAPGITRIRGNLCNVHGRYGPCDGGASTAKKPASRKPRKARKPVKTAAQRQTERATTQAANSKKVFGEVGLSSADTSALEALRSGSQADAASLVRKGLAEQAADGSYRLTPAGRALSNAAKAGDTGRARDILSAAQDRKGASDQRKQTAADKKNQAAVDKWKRQAAREQRQAETKKRREDAAKKRSGSGGKKGGSSRNNSTSSSSTRETERQEDRKRRQAEHAEDRAQRLRERQEDRQQRLRERAEDHAARLAERENRQSTQPQRASSKRPGVIMPVKKQGRRQKSFTVYKSASGGYRWIARSTTAYRDRDKEILTIAALDADSQRMTDTKSYGPLRFWHLGKPDPFNVTAPWGPGVDIGDCDYSTQIGTSRVESGTFRDPRIAERIAQTADQYELSPGFFHPPAQPNADGEYADIHTFERSIVPVKYGRASNYFTGMTIKEFRMDPEEMERRFKAAIEQLQLSPDQASSLAAGLVQADKSAQQQGVAYKSDEQPDPWIGVAMAIKAAMMPAEEKAAMPADEMVEAGETELDDGLDDEATEEGDYLGDLSVSAFETMLATAFQNALAPLVKSLDIAGKMAGHMDELKSMMGGMSTKAAGDTAEIAALKTQLADVAGKLKALQGDQPSIVLPEEIMEALKSSGPATPPDPNAPVVPNDPNRPFAAIAAASAPQLYRQNGDGSFAGWQQPTGSN